MLNRKMQCCLSGVVAFMCLTGCGTSKIVVDVMAPAEFPLPDEADRIVVLNTFSSPLTGNVGELGNLFRGEGALVNSIASQGAVTAFRNEISSASDIDVVTTSFSDHSILSEAAKSAPLGWELVDSLCRINTAGTLVRLKSFSSEIETDYTDYERKAKGDPVKVWSNTIAYDVRMDLIYVARLKTFVTVGWEIYDPGDRRIIVDIQTRDSVFIEAEAESLREAERKLPAIKNVVEDAGYVAGNHFAARIIPRRTTVERTYFTSGNDDFKVANTFIRMRYWDKAAELWEKHTENPERKIAGAAKYNLALIREMNGYPAEALELASSALLDFDTRTITAYIAILQERMAGAQNPIGQ